MEATTPTAKSKRRLRRKRRELDALVVGIAANGRAPRKGNRTSSSSDSSSCGGDDPEAGLCPPRASSSSSGGGCRRREEARRRCGRRHSRCAGGRGPKASGRRCLSSRPRGTFPLAVRSAGACMAVVCLLGAATALAWLFLDARHQTDSLRVHLDAVVAGSKAVPEALQKCHSMSKELQHNQTLLLAQLMTLTSQVNNFSLQVKEVHHGLSEVEDRLKGAPELVRVPQELAELSGSVGRLGSSVGGLDASVTNLKAGSIVLRNETDSLHQELTSLKEAIANVSSRIGSGSDGGNADFSKKEEELKQMIAEIRREMLDLSANVSRLNDTIMKKLIMNDKELSERQKISDTLNNVSSKVSTLEEGSISEQRELANVLDRISSQANKTLDRIVVAERRLDNLSRQIEDQVNQYSRSSHIQSLSDASLNSPSPHLEQIPDAISANVPSSKPTVSTTSGPPIAVVASFNSSANPEIPSGGNDLNIKSDEEKKLNP